MSLRFWINGISSVVDIVALPIATRTAKRYIKTKIKDKPGWLSERIAPKTFAKIKLQMSRHGTPGGLRSTPPEFIGHKLARRLVVVHVADKAGPHVDIHIVDDKLGLKASYVVNLRNKNINLRTNNSGSLTQDSKDQVLDLLRDEFRGRAYIAQSLDHSESQGATEWHNSSVKSGYGAGELREVIADDRIDLFKSGDKLEFMDWTLNPDQESYLFRVFGGDGQKTPIWASGFKKPVAPEFEDRLHLKLDQDLDKFSRLIGEDGTITVKEDGASFKLVVSRSGMRIFSPRISRVTNQPIEYTARIGALRFLTSDQNITGMGELVMYRDGLALPAHEIGGLLNRHQPLPDNVDVKLTVYRIDKVGRQKTIYEPADRNAERIRQLVKMDSSGMLREPVTVQSGEVAQLKDVEGVVGTPKGQSLMRAGRKLKFRTEHQDGVIESINLEPGEKGGVAGVVWYRDDKDGRLYKTSSGFSRALKQDMMSNPEDYIGRTMVLNGFSGHPGRAAKFLHFHQCKGIG